MFHTFYCLNCVKLISSDWTICHGLHVLLGDSKRTQLLYPCKVNKTRTNLSCVQKPQKDFVTVFFKLQISYFTEQFKKL
jgi:hypothetical protein